MRRRGMSAAVGAVALLGLAGCSGIGTADSTGPAAAPSDDENVTVEIWSKFSGRELKGLDAVLADFHKQHPNITIKNVGSQDDEKVTQAIRGGNAPDIAISFSTDNIGQFCSSGAWQDLGPYIKRDDVDLGKLPDATRGYTEFDGTRCAMPLLADVYGLYYNKALFDQAGITEPPKTMDELAEVAKKLTTRAADGSIDVAGFVPTPAFYENTIQTLAPYFGASWLDADGKAALAQGSGWTDMLNWQKDLTDWYGADDLTRFTSNAGQEYSADNAFQAGKIAMILDGEYRTAFIEEQTPDLQYGTAPFPVSDAALYGTAYTTGTITGIPKGAKNPGAAWEVLKYLTTDTHALVKLSNAVKNVPTSTDALDSPELEAPAQFSTFLDLFGGGKLVASPPISLKTAQDFARAYVNGSVEDLQEGLKKLDGQIDSNEALGK